MARMVKSIRHTTGETIALTMRGGRGFKGYLGSIGQQLYFGKCVLEQEGACSET